MGHCTGAPARPEERGPCMTRSGRRPPDDIDALIEEVIVDAYGDDEQLWSFRQWFEDRATLPFGATIVGADVQVVEVDYDGDERRGLTARVMRDGVEHRVTLLDIAARSSIPADTARLLTAYRRWFDSDVGEGL